MKKQLSCGAHSAAGGTSGARSAAVNFVRFVQLADANPALDGEERELMKSAMLSICEVPGLLMPEFKDSTGRPPWAPEVLLRISEGPKDGCSPRWVVQINQLSAAKYFVNEIPYRPGRLDRCLNASVPLWRLFGFALIVVAQSLRCSLQQAFGFTNRIRVARQWDGYSAGMAMLLSAMVAHQALSDSFMAPIVSAGGLFLP